MLKSYLLAILLVHFNSISISYGLECKTVFTEGGSTGGETCVFPFKFNGKTYNQCTQDNDPDGKYWCSLETDKDDNHIAKRQRFGHCDCDIATCCGDTSVDKSSKASKAPEQNPSSGKGKSISTVDKDSGKYLPGFDDCSLKNLFAFENPDKHHFARGQVSLLFTAPYAVLIGSKIKDSTDDIRYRCGGSLINHKYVLTAAHCFLNKTFEYVEVLVGEHDLKTDPDCVLDRPTECAEKVQKIPIEKVIEHKDYTGKGNHLNDIALIRLARPAVYNKAVAPICLPLDTRMTEAILEVPNLKEGLNTKEAYGMGWGRIEAFSNGEFREHGAPSSVLRWGELEFVNHPTCKQKMNNLYGPVSGDVNDELQVCAGHQFRDTCGGDSGGPLMAPGTGANRGQSLIQMGIVSFGSHICGDGNPAVYTRVTAYINWIQDTLQE